MKTYLSILLLLATLSTINAATPGAGFNGPTDQPSARGDGQGNTSTAIARWNSIPYDTFDKEFYLGVLAFHISGIEKVEFSINGGTWESVYSPSINPQTKTMEYWITINSSDLPDGLFEIRAIAYPNQGIPRVLQGPIDASLNATNGNHAMFLNANSKKTLKQTILWTDANNGNDTQGNGTMTNPFKTPGKALAWATSTYGSVDGIIIYLMPGHYSWSSGGTVKNTHRWATLTHAPNTTKDRVVFTTAPTGGMGGITLLKAENITISGPGPRTVTNKPTHFWLDHSIIQGNDSLSDVGVVSAKWTNVYATDIEGKNAKAMFRSVSTLLRNAKGELFADTPLNEDAIIVNVHLQDFIRNPNGDHADVIHGFWNTPGTRENRIIYNLTAKNFSLQGFQINAIRGGGQRYDNVIFKDVLITKDTNNTAGSWWSIDSEHIIFDNTTIPDQPIRWKVSSHDQDGYLNLSNIAFYNSEFLNFAYGPLPSDTLVENTSFKHQTCYQCFVPTITNNTKTTIPQQNRTNTLDGLTTDILLLTNISQVINLTLEKQAYARIVYLETINFLQHQNLTRQEVHSLIQQYILIENNRIIIDTINLPQLNKKARIIMRGITFTQPKIFKDGSECPTTTCIIEHYLNGELTFIVDGFSEYTIIEGYQEQTSNSTESSGGGSGGGGGRRGSSEDNAQNQQQSQQGITNEELQTTLNQNEVIESIGPEINTKKNKYTSFEHILGAYIALILGLSLIGGIILLNHHIRAMKKKEYDTEQREQGRKIIQRYQEAIR